MQTDIDAALRRLAAEPTHPGLENLESAVLARIAVQRRDGRPSSLRLSVMAAIGAVLMGVSSAVMPAATAQASPTLSPFGPSSPLAPSTLLMDIG